jgi:hypothetical protein
MFSALVGRARTDSDFARVLLEARSQRVTLLHFERSGARSYWGGSLRKEDGQPQGRNRLGDMLMGLSQVLAAEVTEVGAAQPAPQPAERLSAEERLVRWGAVGDAIRAGKPWEELVRLARG